MNKRCDLELTVGLCILLVGLWLLSSCHKEQPLLLITGKYPAKPGWTKSAVVEGEDFMYFVGISKYKKTEKEASASAIDSAVKVFLTYAGIEKESDLETFRETFINELTNLRKGEFALYDITISDYYWEKYVIKKTKKTCYKGYILLRWPTTEWLEFSKYVRQTIWHKPRPRQLPPE